VSYISDVQREKGSATSFFRQLYHQFVASSGCVAGIRADGVNRELCATCDLQNFVSGYPALIIFTVTDLG
jgi:hypothetical protein